jgi:chemotaxis signal transduction protein
MDAPSVSTSTYSRYILAGIGGDNQRVIAFPDAFVSSILVIDRANILPVPFYDAAIAGLLPHQGRVMPIVVLRRALGEQGALLPETFPVVHLSSWAGGLEGVGLVVNEVLESVPADHYQPQANHLSIDSILDQLPLELWRPRRWQSRTAV